MDNKKQPLIAHLCMLCAGTCWGLMAPIGKDAMLNGIDGIDLVSFRVLGGALLFWLTSLFTKKEHVPVKDILLLGCAGLFALVFNQCSYTIGLNLTSPSNSSIMTTSMPIFAMVLSFFILKEPITWQKAGGVLLGCTGAVIIITTSARAMIRVAFLFTSIPPPSRSCECSSPPCCGAASAHGRSPDTAA